MAVLTPDSPELASALARPDTLMVAGLCAEWCGTCRDYLPKLEDLSSRFPQHTFVWIDIETHPELLDDEDIENFPTLLIQSPAHTLFYGTILPHISHLERLLAPLDPSRPSTIEAPAVHAALLRGRDR